MKAISTDAIFSSFSSRADGSLSFRGVTPELDTREKVALMDLHNKCVKLIIQPTGESPDEVIEVKTPLGMKTPSQRIRGCLYLLWKQKKSELLFDEFYVRECDRILERLKQQLEPEQ